MDVCTWAKAGVSEFGAPNGAARLRQDFLDPEIPEFTGVATVTPGTRAGEGSNADSRHIGGGPASAAEQSDLALIWAPGMTIERKLLPRRPGC